MVTSQKMSENEIGYRGSKSIADRHAISMTINKTEGFIDLYKPGSHISVIVKEQRVDGS